MKTNNTMQNISFGDNEIFQVEMGNKDICPKPCSRRIMCRDGGPAQYLQNHLNQLANHPTVPGTIFLGLVIHVLAHSISAEEG